MIKQYLGWNPKFNFEIVIIDDCSTDKTFEVLIDLKKKKKYLKIFKNKKNFGFSKSILRAAKKATGKNIKIYTNYFWKATHHGAGLKSQ